MLRLAVALSVLAAASAAAADEDGRKLFTSVTPACALCHTLKDAGATGAIGPSLDELKPDAARVRQALKTGIGQMPAFTQLSAEQVEALAKYVEQATR
ncbi:cytochrome c [Ramlibacter sp. USB13]|uniref:Cytochrome c n=1 Tax=Ramlibacter cellulosilyticus TaxID=2764187 RepID=A0A923MWF2_9BURK|nr:cytochrome c [Ramlibacter cellulosilyticus]MBC5784987.1 cytochrome c [Ramlibacter cellulosilyticus]